ncbi:hypothetical protein OR573_15395 [Halomonas sp. CH40]
MNRYRVIIEQSSTKQAVVKVIEAFNSESAWVNAGGIADALSCEHGGEFEVVNVYPDFSARKPG